jgi:hypothetical protein
VVVVAVGMMKPVHMDDTYLVLLARHIAANPADPFGFEIFWSVWPDLAVDNYVPPLLPYYLAGVIAWAGESPQVMKLALFPLVLMLLYSLRVLLLRISERQDLSALLLVAFAPCLLVSWNLMMDMPALTLGLAAIAGFTVYAERSPWVAPILVGFALALAAQTKYSALVYPLIIVWWAMINGTWRAALLAVVSAAIFFSAWEVFLWAQYGRSQFLWALSGNQHNNGWASSGLIARSMMMNFGLMIAPATLVLLGRFGSGYRWRPALPLFGLLLIMAVFAGYGIGYLSNTALTGLALAAVGAVALAMIVLCYHGLHADRSEANTIAGLGKMEVFLVGWFLVELVFSFAIAPFGAARRVIGITLVALLILLRITRNDEQKGLSLLPQRVALVSTIIVTLGLQLTDIDEARAQAISVADGRQSIRVQDASARIWYVGHWGFAYYADRLGLMPIVPEESRMQFGDWVLVPDGVDSQPVDFSPDRFRVEGMIEIPASLPWSTVPEFYAGVFPIGSSNGVALRVQLLRVTRDHRARIGFDLPSLAQYVRQRVGFRSTLRALPILLDYLDDPDPAVRVLAIRAIAVFGSSAASALPEINRMLTDSEPSVRAVAAAARSSITGT